MGITMGTGGILRKSARGLAAVSMDRRGHLLWLKIADAGVVPYLDSKLWAPQSVDRQHGDSQEQP